MSRLRRLVLCDRWFLVTCNLSPGPPPLSAPEFAYLAGTIQSRRRTHGFLLTAWVFLPDPPRRGTPFSCRVTPARFPLSWQLSKSALRAASTHSASRWVASGRKGRRVSGKRNSDALPLLTLRTVKEYQETVEYIHLNPVKRGLMARPQEWKWSSVHDYMSGVDSPGSILPIDRVLSTSDQRARL